ncbi:hypothetical protein NVV95_13900 [Herbiconiux sp. CPCC 205716]|uniref:Uncharacterized protein n=1 Tax=Herbiconiux gentiana TaxID=2970912 RepID=A0ABT2GHQ9_9MICO|nr:hypothetical protein [Herbiconiux gentiana]MCS5715641.1 hypothetical protein [Herbiconiux gentiana]
MTAQDDFQTDARTESLLSSRDRETLRKLIIDGMTFGPGAELDETYFESLRTRIAQGAR